MDRSRELELLREGKSTLSSRYGVTRLALFGSSARGGGALSKFRMVNQRIGFLQFAAAIDLQGVWHGGEVSGFGE